MFDKLLNFTAPHYCYGCHNVGTLLCADCKYNIISEPYTACVNCRRPRNGATATCKACSSAYSRNWVVGERSDVLKYLINGYKFDREKAAASILAALLDETLPQMPVGTIVTYAPTSNKHRRQRGYDHMRLVAAAFAKRRNLQFTTALHHISNSVQHGAKKSVRYKQAKEAYQPKQVEGAIYLLLDDIFTTGATAEFASRALLKVGADEVWLGIIARQPLD